MIKSLASMSALNLLKAIVQFGISAAVSLFILPHEYGLIAFSIPIISFIALFTDLGLSSAIVRQPRLDAREAGAAFTLSLVVAGGAALLLAAAAFPLERATGLAGLGLVLSVLALAVLLTIAAAIPRAMLERQLRYRRVASIEAASLLVSAVLCIAVLLLGGRVWAVVTFQVLLQALRMILFWIASRTSLSPSFAWRGIAPLLSFGGWVLATNILGFAARNADNLLIGAYIGSTAVGLYGMAYQFMTLPLMAISWPASGVLLATLSQGQAATPQRVERTVVGITQATAMISFPLMTYMTFGLAFVVSALLAPQWQQVVPLIRILALAGAVQSIAAYNGAVLLSQGHARLQFLLGVFNSVLLVGGFIGALDKGLTVFAITYAALTAVTALIGVAVTIRYARIHWAAYLGAIAIPALASGVGIAAVLLLGSTADSWIEWIALSAAFWLTVCAVYALFFRRLRATLAILATSAQRT